MISDILRDASHRVLELPRYAKRSIALSVDISLCVLTAWLAFYLRLGEFVSLSYDSRWASGLFFASSISIAIAIPLFVISGLYRAIFRYSGWPAMVAISRTLAVYGLVYGTLITAIGVPVVPRTIGVIQPLLLFFAIAGSRAVARFWLGGLYRNQLQISALPKALVYGAGSAGRQLVSALSNSYEIRIVGFLDDDDRLHGQALNGKFIFSPSELPGLIESRGVTRVLLAIPSATRRRRNDILKKMAQYPVAVHTLPSLTDLAEGRITISDVHELDIDDLLGRDSVSPNHILLNKCISNKVVLVTGAGGSIGSELCRQIIKLRPKKVLLVEINEYALYTIHSELEGLSHQTTSKSDTPFNHPAGEFLVPLLASVQDEERMLEIMDTWQPDTIYHAAAYKHVPLVEHNVCEGVRNNVIGTLNTVLAAIEKDVSDFVLISTDKAVRPTNVMGASKRLAEICLQSLFNATELTRGINISMVRFGNVLNSSGSVIPRFRKQIRSGGPITLTHPEITRYFMTIPEAAQLVIQAGAMAKGGEVFVLDMGAAVKIASLASRMIELSGLSIKDTQNPDGDIEIIVTGLRPGEKLYEELLLGDDPRPTMHPRIQQAQDPLIPWDKLDPDLNNLKMLLANNDVKSVIAILKKLITDFKPSNEIADWIYAEQINSTDESNQNELH